MDFRGGGVGELYEILRMLSIASTGNRGEIYTLYRLSKWLDVRWVGHQLGAHDLETQCPGTGQTVRIQVKTADPEKAWKNRWAFKILKGGLTPAPYDYLILLGKRAEESQEDYLKKEGDYAVFLIPYIEIDEGSFSSPNRIDLTWAKGDLFNKSNTGSKFRRFYDRFETTYQQAAKDLVGAAYFTSALPMEAEGGEISAMDLPREHGVGGV